MPALLFVVGLLLFVRMGVSEVTDMGWPGADVSPAALISLDLSSFGLTAREPQSARDDPMWGQGNYTEGVLFTYEMDAKPIVGVWALRYETAQAAGNDYNSVRASADNACNLNVTASFGSSGMIHCQFNGGYQKLFWNDYWIVNIVALETAKFTSEALVDQIRDAIAAHWRTFASH